MTSSPHETTSEIIVESITDAFYALDHECRFTYINAQAERLLFRTRGELLGRCIWDEFPEAVGGTFYRLYHRTAERKTAGFLEDYYAPLDAWMDVRVYPSSDGVSVFFQNVNTRKLAEETHERLLVEQALKDNEERLRLATEGAGIGIWSLNTKTNEVTWTKRCYEIVGLPLDGSVTITVDLVYSMMHPEDVLHTKTSRVKSTIENLPFASEYRIITPSGVIRWIQSRGKPYCDEHGVVQRIEGVMIDITVQHETADRLAAANAQRQHAEEQLSQVHQHTMSMLESISDAFFVLDHDWRFTYVNEPAERLMLRKREELLGNCIWNEFLEASTFEVNYRRAVADQESVSFEAFYPPLSVWFEVRAYPFSEGISVCFHDINDRIHIQQSYKESEERYRLLVDGAKDYAMILIDPEGHITSWNAGAVRILGWTEAEVLGQPRDLIFTSEDRASGVPARELIKAATNGKSMDLRWQMKKDGSLFFADGVMEALHDENGTLRGFAKVLRDATTQKRADEQLQQAQATLFEHEHNIATQLQAALTPLIPERVPGMALAKYYKSALDESGVGGDFYDVFSIDKGCTALIVGDLSGKGLAAAAQVATVRNMLRYALYRSRTVVDAIQNLNAVLTEQNLLTGFATLFVGVYDHHNATLTYVNCGQEPALVRRAAGSVEQLAPTGPVLGSFDGSIFDEKVITLGPGDAIALFTDGLTEVGPSRLDMLGITGMIDLLERTVVLDDAFGADDVAEHLTRSLIIGVDAAAHGGVMRDDVCLLVAVVE